MKLICFDQYKEYLEKAFKPYQHLDVVLVQEEADYDHPAIVFNLNQIDEVIQILKHFPSQEGLLGEKNGRYYPINVTDILFIEGFSKDTFAYTMDDFYRISNRISDFESHSLFTRISRSTLVNNKYIQYIVPTLSSKLILHLENDMEIEVSRTYLKAFKSKMEKKVKS